MGFWGRIFGRKSAPRADAPAFLELPETAARREEDERARAVRGAGETRAREAHRADGWDGAGSEGPARSLVAVDASAAAALDAKRARLHAARGTERLRLLDVLRQRHARLTLVGLLHAEERER